jgi:hypothetical protein
MRTLLLAALLVATPGMATAAPVEVSFTGQVVDGWELDTVLPGVEVGDPVSIRFVYDDAAADQIPEHADVGVYTASGGAHGAEIEIGAHLLTSDTVTVTVANQQSDSVGFRTEIEREGVTSAYTVSFREPSGALFDSDALVATQLLSSFTAPPTFQVTGTGGSFVWLYYDAPVTLPAPRPIAALALAGALLVRRGR